MSATEGMLPDRSPGPEIGRVTCGSFPQHPELDSASTSAYQSSFMQVNIPVAVSVSDSWKDRASLSVIVTIFSLPGCPVPVAYTPSPSGEYLGGGGTATASASISAGIAQVQGGLQRPFGRQELATDVTGVATRQLEWRVRGGQRPLAGSYDFRFMVDPDACRYAWLEVTAQVQATSMFRQRMAPGASASAVVPLIAEDAAQAGATLFLHEDKPEPGNLLFVGRPLNLPLAAGPDGVTVASDRSGPGAIRWADDADGGPGYLWVQTSAATVMTGDGTQIVPGASVVLAPGAELRFGTGPCLTVTYNRGSPPAWAAIGTLGSVLEVDVVVGGEVTAHHTTEADYVTVGRSHRDICIDRPDISRMHGVLELGKDGWSYCHKSTAAPAHLRSGGAAVKTINRDDQVRIGPGDVLQLTQAVSLVLR